MTLKPIKLKLRIKLHHLIIDNWEDNYEIVVPEILKIIASETFKAYKDGYENGVIDKAKYIHLTEKKVLEEVEEKIWVMIEFKTMYDVITNEPYQVAKRNTRNETIFDILKLLK